LYFDLTQMARIKEGSARYDLAMWSGYRDHSGRPKLVGAKLEAALLAEELEYAGEDKQKIDQQRQDGTMESSVRYLLAQMWEDDRFLSMGSAELASLIANGG